MPSGGGPRRSYRPGRPTRWAVIIPGAPIARPWPPYRLRAPDRVPLERPERHRVLLQLLGPSPMPGSDLVWGFRHLVGPGPGGVGGHLVRHVRDGRAGGLAGAVAGDEGLDASMYNNAGECAGGGSRAERGSGIFLCQGMPLDWATSLVPLGDLPAWVAVRDDDEPPRREGPPGRFRDSPAAGPCRSDSSWKG